MYAYSIALLILCLYDLFLTFLHDLKYPFHVVYLLWSYWKLFGTKQV